MYTRIDELIWKDAKLKKISNESKLLFIYLLSCQHRNVLGLYNLPKYYVQGDLGYSFETVSKGLEELFNNGFITYDDEAETILVNNFLKYNPLENPNQVKGALKVMPTIPKTQLFYKLVDVIKSSKNTHLHELKAGIESYLKSNGFERVTLTVSKQEEVKEEVSEEVAEQETEKEFVNTGLTTQIKVNENKVNKKKTKENSCENVPASFQKIIDAWNNTVNDLPKVVKVSDGRKRAIRSILKQFNEDSVMTVFKAVCESDFLCGRTDKPWSGCGFDWVMKPSNFVKILEGNYKNRPKQMAGNTGNNKMVSDPFDAEREAAYDAFDNAWLREVAAMEPKGD